MVKGRQEIAENGRTCDLDRQLNTVLPDPFTLEIT